MLVRMDSISMAMFMDMGVRMFMGVLQLDCVLYHKIGADYHDCQGNIELDCGSFTQNQHTECHTKEWCNGVIGTCLCCS